MPAAVVGFGKTRERTRGRDNLLNPIQAREWLQNLCVEPLASKREKD